MVKLRCAVAAALSVTVTVTGCELPPCAKMVGQVIRPDAETVRPGGPTMMA